MGGFLSTPKAEQKLCAVILESKALVTHSKYQHLPLQHTFLGLSTSQGPWWCYNLPGLLSGPDGGPLGWAALWENPQMMEVEEERGMMTTAVEFCLV